MHIFSIFNVININFKNNSKYIFASLNKQITSQIRELFILVLSLLREENYGLNYHYHL